MEAPPGDSGSSPRALGERISCNDSGEKDGPPSPSSPSPPREAFASAFRSASLRRRRSSRSSGVRSFFFFFFFSSRRSSPPKSPPSPSEPDMVGLLTRFASSAGVQRSRTRDGTRPSELERQICRPRARALRLRARPGADAGRTRASPRDNSAAEGTAAHSSSSCKSRGVEQQT
jgi:hypothetical protein